MQDVKGDPGGQVVYRRAGAGGDRSGEDARQVAHPCQGAILSTLTRGGVGVVDGGAHGGKQLLLHVGHADVAGSEPAPSGLRARCSSLSYTSLAGVAGNEPAPSRSQPGVLH